MASPVRPDWAKPAQLVGAAVGVWLMAAPAVLDYVDTTAGELHRTVGPLVATASLTALWPVTRDVRWANLALAAALVVGVAFGGHPSAAVTTALTAAVALACSTPFGGPDRSRRGAGWRSVLAARDGDPAAAATAPTNRAHHRRPEGTT